MVLLDGLYTSFTFADKSLSSLLKDQDGGGIFLLFDPLTDDEDLLGCIWEVKFQTPI